MMSHVKTVLFIVLCLAAGVGIGKGIIWLREPAKRGFEKNDGASVVTGVGDAPAYRGFTLTAAALPHDQPPLLQQSSAFFATTVGIEYGPTLTREALVSAATAAHRKHIAVVLLPPPVFHAQNPYPRPLAEIAADAQAAKVEFLCISWLHVEPDPAYWQPQAQSVREAYSGKLILAGVPAVLPGVNCWEAADLVGAIGPIALARRLPGAPEDVTVHDMRVAWDCSLTSLESLARVNKKTLALLQMNVPLEVSASLPSPEAENVTPPKNPALQQLLYDALLLETKGRAEVTEILLFNWGGAGDAAAPNNVPGLLARIGDAWDPKKPKPVELPPADAPVDTPVAGGDAATLGNP